jgi:hypothetical protein
VECGLYGPLAETKRGKGFPVLRSPWLAVVVMMGIEGGGGAIELEQGFWGEHLGRGADAKQAAIQANHLGGNAQDHVEFV